jgi:methylated-DNA-[protein]-cysteine S-methyltransferase
MTTTSYCCIDSPIGRLLLAGFPGELTLIDFQRGPRPRRPDPEWREDHRAFADAIAQLHEYFGGTRRVFSLRLSPSGTPFQQRVWQALLEIPYGETTSYGELARRIDRPAASRAVGLANGSNPLPIVIPCHRVIGSNGSLTGYGGGLPIKGRLLELERGERRLL